MAQRKRNPGAIRDLEAKTFHGPNGVFLTGCIPSNSTGDATNDLDFSAGFYLDEIRSYVVTGMTGKRQDANWAVGNGNGMRAAGSATWGTATDRYLFLLVNPDTGQFDYGSDTVLTASNLLTDAVGQFSVAKRVSALRTATAAWQTFSAREVGIGIVQYKLPITFQFTKDWTASDDTAQTGTLADVPGGIKVKAKISAVFRDSTATVQSAIVFSSFDQPDVAPSPGVSTFAAHIHIFNGGGGDVRQSAEIEVETSTSRTIRYRANGTTSDHSVGVCLDSFEDSRL